MRHYCKQRQLFIISLIFLIAIGCSSRSNEGQGGSSISAFVGGNIIDGTGSAPVENAVFLVSGGKITAIGKHGEFMIPDEATVIDLSGKTIMPGIINAHGHVGVSNGLQSGYSRDNVIRDLNVNARYGVTTIVSLGDDQVASVELRNAQNVSTLDRSRLFVAGRIVTGNTPEEVKQVIDYDDSLGVDFIKIRVDDNLGTSEKMPEKIYQTVIDYSHELGYRVASHIFYLEDAKSLLKAGTAYIAHSVRDRYVDQEFVDMMKQKGVYYCPTLMRDVSTFVFSGDPDYFDDPFFTREVSAATIAELRDPERKSRIANSPSAQAYRVAVDTAIVNLKRLADAGVTIVMGTDSGVAGRFPGYFEHLEMKMMEEAGMKPMEVIVSATGGSAKALQLADIGTLETGKWADFIVLEKDPLEDIAHTRSIASVWIAGNEVKR